MVANPSPIELLELDIDLRMASLWEDVVEVDEWSDDVALALMRAAYGKGYADALSEDEPGLLCARPWQARTREEARFAPAHAEATAFVSRRRIRLDATSGTPSQG